MVVCILARLCALRSWRLAVVVPCSIVCRRSFTPFIWTNGGFVNTREFSAAERRRKNNLRVFTNDQQSWTNKEEVAIVVRVVAVYQATPHTIR